MIILIAIAYFNKTPLIRFQHGVIASVCIRVKPLKDVTTVVYKLFRDNSGVDSHAWACKKHDSCMAITLCMYIVGVEGYDIYYYLFVFNGREFVTRNRIGS